MEEIYLTLIFLGFLMNLARNIRPLFLVSYWGHPR